MPTRSHRRAALGDLRVGRQARELRQRSTRCEGVSWIPCFDEDCAPDGVRDPSAYDRLPEFVNAGEEAAMPRVTDLDPLGFPGDDAWAMQDFCGGLGRTSCSPRCATS